MAGTLRMDYRQHTYRQLFVMYESFVQTSWDHTAYLASHLSAIMTVLIKANSKKGSKAKAQTFFDCHPYRQQQKLTGHRINRENIRDLKTIFSR